MIIPLDRTLSQAVSNYRAAAPLRQKEDKWWQAADQPLDEAIERAALAKMKDGRLHSHQRRPPAGGRIESARRLKLISSRIGRCATFHDLMELVQTTIGDVPGVGELTIYDTVDRIGSHLGLVADRIYLHAGTRAGAQALIPFLGRRDEWIHSSQLPAELQELSCREAEDVLCIYKDAFCGKKSVTTCGGTRGCCRPSPRIC